MAKRKIWTKADDDYLKANYADTNSIVLMDYLGCTYYSLMNRAYSFGLKKSANFLRSLVTDKMLEAALKTQFKKGNKSWNKGTKGLTGANSGSFKKRQRPHNWKPIGSERVTKDGYIEVKYKDEYKAVSNYELKQRIVWIDKYGPIPKGSVVSFRDGDSRNFDIDNLELLTKSESMLRNQMKDSTIAKRFIGTDNVGSDEVQSLIRLKRAELMLNKKIRGYDS